MVEYEETDEYRREKINVHKTIPGYILIYEQNRDAEPDDDRKARWQKEIDTLNAMTTDIEALATANGWDLNTTEDLSDAPELPQLADFGSLDNPD